MVGIGLSTPATAKCVEISKEERRFGFEGRSVDADGGRI